MDLSKNPQKQKNNKRLRETDPEELPASGKDKQMEPRSKRNTATELPNQSPSPTNSTNHQKDGRQADNANSQENGGEEKIDNSTKEVNDDSLKTTPPMPMGPAQWEQIMLRFDSFEKSIQTTIKEEIKINSTGIQKQVKTLGSKVKEVEKNISDNTNEIAKINQKVESINYNPDNLQEAIASEVEKQVSERVAQLEKDLKNSNTEIAKLKNAKPSSSMQEPNPSQVSRHEFQKEQCFNRQRNLMLMGVEEPKEGEDERPKISEILQNRLGIDKPKIDRAIRMGTSTGKLPRPVLITFGHMHQRFQVWHKKSEINKDQTQKLWVQEDLPKALRYELSALLKIKKKAKSLPDKYPEVKIRDFKIKVQGRFYNAQQLELLPDDLKPSRTTTPQSDDAVVFFGRSSPMSNHHLCNINIAGRAFTCVEHFLAWQRANVAKDEALAKEVLEMKDPSEHKKVLNSLKEKNQEQWEDTVENVLLTVLRAKFKQNEKLKKFLCDTYPRRIGEASINPQWGIGMSLTNENVLDTSKWNENGNRLGKALQMVREELLQGQP